MNVTYVHADKSWEWNSAHWRCTIPAQALNRTKRHRAHMLGIQAFVEGAFEAEYHLEHADVIVLQRGAMPDAWPQVRRWRESGKFVVADIDDGYPQITAEHPAYAFWHLGQIKGPDGQILALPRPAIRDMAAGLEMLGALTSPSRVILDDWRGTIPTLKVEHIPNYIDLAHYAHTRTRENDGTTWVAWGGSAGHLGSFLHSGVADAICRVLSARPLTRFVMCGSDTRILDRIPLKHAQKLHFNWRHFRQWPALLVNFDVGLIPLAGAFDARRSTLKPLEYSLMRVPWIASKSPAYEGLDDFGVFVDNSPEAWADALIDAIDSVPDKRRLERANDWAESHDIRRSANIHRIIDAYARMSRKR